jgi:NADPH:quinone reductase-like Zn-dependent oxidoreductase
MKAVRIHKFRGGPQDLVYEDVPRPNPKEGEILVKVRATGVTLNENSLDLGFTGNVGSSNLGS